MIQIWIIPETLYKSGAPQRSRNSSPPTDTFTHEESTMSQLAIALGLSVPFAAGALFLRDLIARAKAKRPSKVITLPPAPSPVREDITQNIRRNLEDRTERAAHYYLKLDLHLSRAETTRGQLRCVLTPAGAPDTRKVVSVGGDAVASALSRWVCEEFGVQTKADASMVEVLQGLRGLGYRAIVLQSSKGLDGFVILPRNA